MKNVFDNGGYIGKKATYGLPVNPLGIGSVGSGASVQGTGSISWTHTTTAEDRYIIAAISAYNYESPSAWVGNADIDGVTMTKTGGYRVVVFTAPVSGVGTKTITYNYGSGYPLYAAGNSISVKNAISLGTPTAQSGSDGGTHAATGTSAANSMVAFFTGQVWDSAAPATPSGFTQQFWTRQTGTYSAVGCYTAVVPAGGAVSFSVYTGNSGSTIWVPLGGSVES